MKIATTVPDTQKREEQQAKDARLRLKRHFRLTNGEIDKLFIAVESFLDMGEHPADLLPAQYGPYNKAVRVRATKAFSELADRILVLGDATPRCVVEEMFLYAMLDTAIEFSRDEGKTRANLEEMQEDAFQDHDFLHLYNPAMDGFVEADTENRMGYANLKFADWFDRFNNV